ncbi:sensor histidine kinase [Dactylosporangium sp. CA-233914]|uniref:sensor histidine kinase n=1 Tax=Dactylosporangium sp. CA-233914 TaxID=3239934 RepID=UPI003D8EAD82
MRSGSSHVRTKIVALLLSLVALWSFAAWVTSREGLNLLTVSTLDKTVGRPAESLVEAMQQERRLSVIYLAGPTSERRQALAEQRSRTDAAHQKFNQLTRRETDGSDMLHRRIANAAARLDQLSQTRTNIDARTMTRAQAADFFSGIVSDTLLIFGALSTLDDAAIINDGRTLVEASYAREILAQEDTLLTGVLAAGKFAAATEHAQFVQLVGAQRVRYAEVAGALPEADRIAYEAFVQGEVFGKFRAAEDLIVNQARAGGALPLDTAAWQAVVEPVFDQLRGLVLQAADHLIARAGTAAVGVIIRIALAGGLGLVAVIASIIISFTTARSLLRQLERLRDAAFALANERLPGVVARIGRGDSVDVAAEAPPLKFGRDEVGQLGDAFNLVQETAIRTAVEQAELRRNIREVFLSLARRTQSLVHRQLTLLDEMEHLEHDEEALERLFRVDHLATRMRRNAENLIVLAGANVRRTWRQPVPVIDIIRAAVAEVEDYPRVTVSPSNPAGVAGVAALDISRLLTELIENATTFSPPHTPVSVRGQKVSNGYVVEVEDRGLGMSDEDLATANTELKAPPEFVFSPAAVRLGLFVVGRLAARHGIRVELCGSPYGGTKAIVLIPQALVVAADAAEPAQPAPAEAAPDGSNAQGALAAPSAALNAARRAGGTALLAAPPAEAPAEAPAQFPVQPNAVERSAAPPAARTPNGLPRRRRQVRASETVDEPVAAPQSPDATRSRWSSYQQLTARGREQAKRAVQPSDDADAPVEPEPGNKTDTSRDR